MNDILILIDFLSKQNVNSFDVISICFKVCWLLLSVGVVVVGVGDGGIWCFLFFFAFFVFFFTINFLLIFLVLIS